MNSSTSSSEGLRIFVPLIGTVLLLLSMVNVLLYLYARQATTVSSYIEDIVAKSRHMQLNYPDVPPDIVFIGSSKTQYHVSQAVFQAHGQDVYNYGVPGAKIVNLPFMTSRVSRIRPKLAVIGISADRLYEDRLTVSERILWDDLHTAMQAGVSRQVVLEMLRTYIRGFNLLRTYADGVHSRIRNWYHRLGDLHTFRSASRQPDGDMDAIDCRPLSTTRLTSGVRVVKCTNGDGVLLGHDVPDRPSPKSARLTRPNPDAMHLLQQSVHKLQSAGIRVIIVFEPSLDMLSIGDTAGLERQLGAQVIDLGALEFPRSAWADVGHLNNAGRLIYSEHLAMKIASEPMNRGR